MMQVAADLADGANTYMQPPEHTATSRATLGPDKALSVVLPCVLTTDADAARAAGRRALHIYLPLPAYHRQWVAFGFDESDWGRGVPVIVSSTPMSPGATRTRSVDGWTNTSMPARRRCSSRSTTPTATPWPPPWDLLEAMAPT